MEGLKLALTVALLLAEVFCQDTDADIWREGVRGENPWPNSGVLQDILVRMTRKPGPRQFVGLMGKKDSGRPQTAGKRHRFQTFVGLMGRRSAEDQGAL